MGTWSPQSDFLERRCRCGSVGRLSTGRVLHWLTDRTATPPLLSGCEDIFITSQNLHLFICSFFSSHLPSETKRVIVSWVSYLSLILFLPLLFPWPPETVNLNRIRNDCDLSICICVIIHIKIIHKHVAGDNVCLSSSYNSSSLGGATSSILESIKILLLTLAKNKEMIQR